MQHSVAVCSWQAGMHRATAAATAPEHARLLSVTQSGVSTAVLQHQCHMSVLAPHVAVSEHSSRISSYTCLRCKHCPAVDAAVGQYRTACTGVLVALGQQTALGSDVASSHCRSAVKNMPTPKRVLALPKQP